MSYGSGHRFAFDRLARDLERARAEVPVHRPVPERNFFGEPYPLAIIDQTIGLLPYLQWLLNGGDPPDTLLSAVSQRPAHGIHTILSANPSGCLRQLRDIGRSRGPRKAPKAHPVLAHLAALWHQWEHDTGRVHSSAHIARWQEVISSKTFSQLREVAGEEQAGVEEWRGPALEGDPWAKLQGWVDHQLARNCFDHFIQCIQPSYVFEEFHCLLARLIEFFTWTPAARVILCVPPRGGKSQAVSIHAPPWQIAQRPWGHLMAVSYAKTLSKRFSTQARGHLLSPVFGELFPHVQLTKTEAGEWNIQHDNPEHPPGEYYASGIEGGIAGRGFNLGTTDDLLSEQTMYSDLAKDKAWDWWKGGFLTREMSPGMSSIGVVSTRYAYDDPVGRLLAEDEGVGEWTELKIPALLKTQGQVDLLNRERLRALRLRQRRENLFALNSRRKAQTVEATPPYEIGSSFSPIRHAQVELEKKKRTTPTLVWSALYDQEPSAGEGNIILKQWWRPWPHDKLPWFEFTFAMYDTAYEEAESADYTARTTWGLFEYESRLRMMMIESWRARVGIPELRKLVKEHHQHFNLDLVLVEAKASGKSVVQEVVLTGVPALQWLPSGMSLTNRARGKIPRAYSAAPTFEAGNVFYVEGYNNRLVIDETTVFPSGAHDDWCDTVTGAVLWTRDRYALHNKGDYDPRADANPEDARDYEESTAPQSARERALQEIQREARR